jgi:diguanylate cyclase (GGDEF)-like protein
VILIIGAILSLLLASMVFVLATGRQRARELVETRTRELAHQALYDSLTGLPNRTLVIDRLDHMLARARRERSPIAVLFVDLDNFKDVNDTLGHAAGDQLLAQVANRFSDTIREGDTVGRMGGDEFVVLLEGSSLGEGAQEVAQRLVGLFSRPFELPGYSRPLRVTASIGIATDSRMSSSELLQQADIALYEAKASGKECAVDFTPSMMDLVRVRRDVEVDLAAALEREEFFMVYQPVVDLLSGRVVGAESLLRWRRPEHGIVEPAGFVPILEETKEIFAVGRWALATACRQVAAWRQVNAGLSVSVNVSSLQLRGGSIVEDVASILKETGIDPASLILELTETALMEDVHDSISVLERLKEFGVRVAVDDFGTGYSSLAHLEMLPLDILKIDKSFVDTIAESGEEDSVLRILILMGHSLGLVMTAEGVETDAQRAWLTGQQVAYGQGALFSEPLEADAVSDLVTQVA